MNCEPLVSIIIPIFNVEKYLNKCIDSVLNQTYRQLEILLVDDGSTDSCGSICDWYEQSDQRIRCIHKSNGGLSDARNAGIDRATGEYLFFLDADDYIELQTIAKMVDKMQNTRADIVVCGIDYVNESDLTDNRIQYSYDGIIEEGDIPRFLLLSDNAILLVVVWNKLYKKEIFSELRYPLGKKHEDEFLAHRICGQVHRVSFLPDLCYKYVQRNDSIMGMVRENVSLDAVEAKYDRLLYYEDMKEREFFEYTWRALLYQMAVVYEKIRNKDEVSKREYMDEFDQWYTRMRDKWKQSKGWILSGKTRIQTWIFFRNPGWNSEKLKSVMIWKKEN